MYAPAEEKPVRVCSIKIKKGAEGGEGAYCDPDWLRVYDGACVGWLSRLAEIRPDGTTLAKFAAW